MKINMKEDLRALLGEFIGTFMFLSSVFAILVNTSRTSEKIESSGIVSGIAISLITSVLVFCFADVSGSHFNPAVTFGFLVTGKMHAIKCACYILIQLIAGYLASWFQFAIFPGSSGEEPSISEVLLVTKPSSTPFLQATIMEAFLTFVLVYVVFALAVDSPMPPKIEKVNVFDDEDEMERDDIENRGEQDTEGTARSIFVANGTATKTNFAPIMIGITIGVLGYLGSSSSGAAYNPARAFGPALLALDFSTHWIYWVGDLIGACCAALVQNFVLTSKHEFKKKNQ